VPEDVEPRSDILQRLLLLGVGHGLILSG
jgi:hypothetical protein